MARKPNYRADRIERDRAKAAKKAKRAEARAEKTAKPTDEVSEDGEPVSDLDTPGDAEPSASEKSDD